MQRILRSLALALLVCGSLPACVEGAPETAQNEEDVTASTARFELFVGEDGQHYFQLVAKNGERLLRSEGYTSLSGAKKGITSVQKNGVVKARFDVNEADNGEFYFNLKATNGQIIATGETYTTQSGANAGVDAVISAVAKAVSAQAEAGEARFETFKGAASKTYFRLRAANGQIVLDSQGYSSKSSATKGITSVETNGIDATNYHVVAGEDGQHTFQLVAGNGQVIARGEMYSSKSNALRGAARVREILRDLTGEGEVTDAELQAEITKATEGLLYTSESDYPFQLVTAPIPAGTPITEQLVREQLAPFVDDDEDADKPLATLYSMEETWQSWKDKGVGCYDPEDPVAVEICARTRNMEQVLEANLTGIHVYYFGAKGKPGDVHGTGVTIFIVGLTPTGQLAGVRTLAIWT